jgi:hypothetical protein
MTPLHRAQRSPARSKTPRTDWNDPGTPSVSK